MIWIILAAILPIVSLLNPGMPLVHDGQDHVARIANFYAALQEGILVPRWAGNLNWGYGHPILMFLYPLPSYFASLFHFLGLSFVDSTKLVFGISYLASAVTMYLWARAAFEKNAGTIAAVLYAFAPYRFVDLHVRGAIGEHVAFIFPPLIMYFILKKQWVGMSLAWAALILSHNAIALMFLPIILLWAWYCKHLFTLPFLLFTVLGFGASAFFWTPALLEGKFTLRDIVTSGEVLQRFVSPVMFFYSPWNYGGTDTLSKFLGFPQWAGIIAAIVLVLKTKKKATKNILLGSLLLLVGSLFMMTEFSRPLWASVKILQNFQFPWRFLSVAVFISAVIGGVALSGISKKMMIVFCVIAIVITANMWRPKAYQLHDDSFYSGVYPGTTDTGESSPIWSVRFMEHTAASHISVVDGSAVIKEIKRTTVIHEYELEVGKPSLLVENTLYFPGWKIYVDGVPVEIQFQNPDYRGLMTFRVTEGAKHVRVTFENTKVRTISNWISVASLGILIVWLKINRRYQ